jgi:hypothetical protein
MMFFKHSCLAVFCFATFFLRCIVVMVVCRELFV